MVALPTVFAQTIDAFDVTGQNQKVDTRKHLTSNTGQDDPEKSSFIGDKGLSHDASDEKKSSSEEVGTQNQISSIESSSIDINFDASGTPAAISLSGSSSDGYENESNRVEAKVPSISNISSLIHTSAHSDISLRSDALNHGAYTDSTHNIVEGETTISAKDDLDHRESSAEKWGKRRRVALYLVTITILFADMNLLAPNLTTIADEFGFDDDERDVKLGGLLALGFFFVGAPVSFLVGWLADSVNRSPLFAATVFLGELGCLFVAFVKTYPQLYVCRVLTGISIGGAIPCIYSVLGDLYPANQRAAVASVVTTGTGLGMGIGQVIAGSMASWRTPFLIVSIPGIICSVLLAFVKDPKRGAKEAAVLEMEHENWKMESTLTESDTMPGVRAGHVESLKNCGMDCRVAPVDVDRQFSDELVQNVEKVEEADQSPFVSCNSTCDLMKIPSVGLTILQAAPGALPFGFCATFLNDYLQEQRGMTKQEATGVLLTFGAGNAIGVILGGILGHFSYKIDVRGPPFVMGVSLILGCIPFYFLINNVDDNESVGAVAGITILSGILVVVPVPLERSILTNVCLPRLRGRANAVVSIVDDLGKGLGPALVSLLITTFDRQTAFNISLVGWIIGGMISLAIMPFVAKDEAAVQQQLRDALAVDD